MSAPVFDADGRVWAALTIAAPAQRFGPAEMRPLAAPLKAAAAAISLELGYQGLPAPARRQREPAIVAANGQAKHKSGPSGSRARQAVPLQDGTV
jgi:hypothetical protein